MRTLKIAGLVLVALVVGAFVALRFLGPPPVDGSVVARSVHQEPALLERAWALPVARTFSRPLHSQPNPSMCGPTSLVDALRSFGVAEPDERALLAGTGLCRTGVCFGGLTLDDVAEVARHAGRKATVLRDLTPDEFREVLRRSNDPSRRYVVNFTRRPIFHAGGGHFSPLGGYLEDRDLVFVLDVNDRYRPWLVERQKLFAAVDTVDPSTGKKRGLVEIR